MNSVPVRKKYSVTIGNRIRIKDFRAPTRETPRMMRTPKMIFMLIEVYSLETFRTNPAEGKSAVTIHPFDKEHLLKGARSGQEESYG
jgi:hypothetical protein